MPAIHPARMKIQVAQLGEKIRQPEAFGRELHNLLDYYADRTRRAGQFGEPPPLLDTYKTPPPVFRQIERELSALVDDPPAALALVDVLWVEPVLEFRLLAVRLLGQLPPVPPDPLLARLRGWIATAPETRIQEAILEHSLARLRRETPLEFFPLVEAWLKAGETYPRQTGLRALVYLVSDPGYDNLPPVFHLILPWIRAIPAPLKQEMAALVRALASHFPQELSFILRQNLSDDRPDPIWLARQALPELPPEVQSSLRTALRQYQK